MTYFLSRYLAQFCYVLEFMCDNMHQWIYVLSQQQQQQQLG